jgi:hypothetical protein
VVLSSNHSTIKKEQEGRKEGRKGRREEGEREGGRKNEAQGGS